MVSYNARILMWRLFEGVFIQGGVWKIFLVLGSFFEGAFNRCITVFARGGYLLIYSIRGCAAQKGVLFSPEI